MFMLAEFLPSSKTHNFCTITYCCVVHTWGGVGWGNNVQLHLHLHTHTHIMLLFCTFFSLLQRQALCQSTQAALTIGGKWWKIQSPIVSPQPRGGWRWIKKYFAMFDLSNGDGKPNVTCWKQQQGISSNCLDFEDTRPAKEKTCADACGCKSYSRFRRPLFLTPKLTFRCGETTILCLKCGRWKFRRDVYVRDISI